MIWHELTRLLTVRFISNFLQCVGEDIEDLEYTPKPEFEGCFKVINVKNEVL